MTVCVGLECSEGVWLGFDQAYGTHEGQMRVDNKGYQLKSPEWGLGLAFTGSRHDQVGRFILPDKLTESPPAGAASVEKWLLRHFVPALRTTFQEEHLDCASDEEDKACPWSALVAVRGTLWALADDWTLGRHVEGFWAVGSGAAYAIGSLASGTLDSAEARVLSAVQIACRYSAHCAKAPNVLPILIGK